MSLEDNELRLAMKRCKILNRLRTSLDNADALISWLIAKHPEILDEYAKSDFKKILDRDNKYSSLLHAIFTLGEKNKK